MKKRMETLGGVLLLALVLTACGKEKPAGQQRNVASGSAVVTQGAVVAKGLQEKSGDYTGQLVAGMFDTVYADFDENLAGQLSKEQFKASWQQVTGELQEYQGIQSTKELTSSQYEVIIVTIGYADNKGVEIKFVYNKQEQISGIWFSHVQLTDSAEEQNTYEEIEYEIKRENGSLSGILTLPTGEKNPPVVLLFQNEDSDWNGTIGTGQSQPLCDLAKGLAKNGIASLRYHTRKYERPTECKNSDGINELFLQDASQAVNQIYTDRRINKNKIILLGIGQSAQYLSALVEQKCSRIAGVVLVAPAPRYVGEKNYQTGETVEGDIYYYKKKNMTTPLLALYGDADQETAKEEWEYVKQMWQRRSHITYREYGKLNHYLIKEAVKNHGGGYEQKGEVSQQPIEDLVTWIKQR